MSTLLNLILLAAGWVFMYAVSRFIWRRGAAVKIIEGRSACVPWGCESPLDTSKMTVEVSMPGYSGDVNNKLSTCSAQGMKIPCLARLQATISDPVYKLKGA
jgi:hypothetical protein